MLLPSEKLNFLNKQRNESLTKAVSWKEELHPRDSRGRFTKKHSWTGIRTGSEVVAKNGTKGKVKSVTNTHYVIEKADGKTSRIKKENVVHAKDHAELTTKKKASTKKASTKKASTKKASTKKSSTKKSSTKGVGKSIDKPKRTKESGSASKASKPTNTTKAKSKTNAGRNAGKSTTPTKRTKTPTKKAQTKAAVKDIRSEAQKNRELAYDVGDKIGGARKDTYQKNFYNHPTPEALQKLEEFAPEIAQVACKKQNILKKVDFEAEYKKGTDVEVALLKQLIYDRISPKPSEDTPEARMAYLLGIHELHRILTPIKSWEDMRGAVRDLSDIARAGSRLEDAERMLNRPAGYGYVNTEYYEEVAKKGRKAKKTLDFNALGDKLENFFVNYDSRQKSIDNIRRKRLSWDKYLNPSEVAKKPKTPRGAKKKRWERAAVSEHMRTGGKATTVEKPEDMVKQFGMKGVEFGHWVDDSAGLFHLKRSAEAFHDLADVLGVKDKDISLNGRLSMAFGARGKGGAVAHYEPDRKVINMTKHGGAGSLAHEWGHALDNILYMYSTGSKGSILMASEGSMGDKDIKLSALYRNLMESITLPVPGEKGGIKKVTLDSSTKMQTSYYPSMRRDAESGMSAEELYIKWADKFQREKQVQISVTMRNPMRSEADKQKKIKSIERKYTRKVNELAHMVASEMRYVKYGRGSKEHFKAEIEVPTGESEYLTRMKEMDGGGKPYYAQNAEMFARVFESYIEDKLKAKKRKNNYLVWGTKEDKNAPFPIGKERKAMHRAMDELLKYVTKGGVLKKALEFDLQKAWDESKHPRDERGRFTMSYVRIHQDTPNMGAEFGQDIEPHGEYMSHDTMDGRNRIPLPNYEYGKVAFNNPLIMPHEGTGHGGWKTKLSERFGGKVGKELSEAVMEAGHDAIVTYDEYGISEVVNLAGEKSKHEDPRRKEVQEHNRKLTRIASAFGSAEEFAEKVDRPGFGGKSISEIYELIDNNSHNHLNAEEIKTTLAQGGNYYYLTYVDPKVLYVQDEDHLKGVKAEPFDQTSAKPIVVGDNGFIVDGRHRTVNAKNSGLDEILAYIPAKAYYNLHVRGNPFMKSILSEDFKKALTLYDYDTLAAKAHVLQKAMEGKIQLPTRKAKAEYRRIMSKDYWRMLVERYIEVYHNTMNKEEAFNYTVEDYELEHDEARAFWEELNRMGQNIPEDVHALRKSVIPDPTGTSPYPEDGTMMFRGIGQKEMDFINEKGYIQSKGKGNDDDKERETCFSNTFRQAEGYARSNFDLYNEKAAYVLVLPRPPWVEEDEHAELISKKPIPAFPMVVVPVPKPE